MNKKVAVYSVEFLSENKVLQSTSIYLLEVAEKSLFDRKFWNR